MSASRLPDAEELLQQLIAQMRPAVTPETGLIGIVTGGAWLAERLHAALKLAVPFGTLDVSFYRDDYNQRGLHSETRPSKIPFEVEDRHIILIDDVFYTGRTIRAAMNELFDYGRPASITLAVLVNRGGRELPITPQISAFDINLDAKQNLQLLRQDDGKFYLSLEENANA